MATNKQLHKIQSFVEDQVKATKNSVVLITTKNGYKVNNFNIHLKGTYWALTDSLGSEISRFQNVRMAILAAALHVKKKFGLLAMVEQTDSKLFTLKHDKYLFEHKISNKYNKEVYEDRLSRTTFELDSVYKQISELEKSVGLQ